MSSRLSRPFLLKIAAAIGLIVLADQLFWALGGLGSNVGLFAAAWTLALAVAVPAVRRDRRAVAALVLAAGLCVVLGDDPGLLAWAMFWAAVSVAVLMPRVARFGAAPWWLLRLIAQAVAGVVGPWRDLLRMRRVRRGTRRFAVQDILALLPLPLFGGAVFFALFAAANPVIGDAIGKLALPEFQPLRVMLWGVVLVSVWTTLRPRRLRWTLGQGSEEREPIRLPGVSVGSVTLSLIAFNALFAVQNGLDLAFLWSGAALPDGMTLAAYAHRGAYPLIATALLAGLFVLVTLRPGSATAAVPLIRRLVVLWVMQNVFLVASSILRTFDYIDAYSLTRLRIAALLWMGLVAVGLVLILWRMLTGRSATWLVNANMLAGGAVLVACSAVDLGAVAASWNVRHAREAGGRGAALDLCYLGTLGPSSLVSLVELETRRGLNPDFADRVAAVRVGVARETLSGQRSGWWTLRNERRLAQVHVLAGKLPNGFRHATAAPYGRSCNGERLPPEAAPVSVDPDTALTTEHGE